MEEVIDPDYERTSAYAERFDSHPFWDAEVKIYKVLVDAGMNPKWARQRTVELITEAVEQDLEG